MRHLVLPADHSSADLTLAGDVMVTLRSESLYVAWTIDHGEAAPAVEAVVVEDHDLPATARPGLLARLRARLGAIAHAIRHAERRSSAPAALDARTAASSQLPSRSS